MATMHTYFLIQYLITTSDDAVSYDLFLGVTARVISGVASHIQVEETEALHVSRIALMVRGY
ncbi:MAG: hypothetical protein BECKG1743D_GA0114223_103187, partial [Candidatus Kentron sp. G]